MTQSEYIELLKRSEIFQRLGTEEQKIVRDASGDLMENYAALFTDAQNILTEVQNEYMKKNVQIVQDFLVKIRKIKKEKIQIDENSNNQVEIKEQKKLLDELSQI